MHPASQSISALNWLRHAASHLPMSAVAARNRATRSTRTRTRTMTTPTSRFYFGPRGQRGGPDVLRAQQLPLGPVRQAEAPNAADRHRGTIGTIVATVGADPTSSRALAETRGACSPFSRRAAGRSMEALLEEICA